MTIAVTSALCIFWLSFGLIIYTYFVYPVILFVCYALAQLRTDLHYLLGRRDRRISSLGREEVPGVSFIVPAFNEERHLPEKLLNLRESDYPRDKFQVILVSDGSTDSTNEILGSVTDENFDVAMLTTRSGKAQALNHAVSRARHDLLVFSDASTLFASDAVRKLVRHFTDERVGAVCGALGFQASAESQQTEGVYWKYESILRLMEGRLGATLTASGAIYALRREAYVPLAPGTVLDDFIVPMNARKIGFEIVYDPEATAVEFAPDTVSGEFTRRVRIAAGSFQALRELVKVPLRGFVAFSFVSHKLLRWTVPLFLLTLILSNAVLLKHRFYAVFGMVQLAFYLWAFIGFIFRERMQRIRFALVGYFLLAMNLAFLVGFFRYLKSREGIAWQRTN